jgi:hypothetical protein
LLLINKIQEAFVNIIKVFQISFALENRYHFEQKERFITQRWQYYDLIKQTLSISTKEMDDSETFQAFATNPL